MYAQEWLTTVPVAFHVAGGSVSHPRSSGPDTIRNRRIVLNIRKTGTSGSRRSRILPA
jgi:hypothetical protein